jgi:hypothetical protein
MFHYPEEAVYIPQREFEALFTVVRGIGILGSSLHASNPKKHQKYAI